MGKGIGWRKSLLFLWFLVFDTFCLPAFSQSNDWDVTILDRLLASVKHGQVLVQVGDMFVTVSNLRAWRSQLAGAPMPLSAFDGAIPTWTSGTVYYTFSNNVSVAHQQAFFDGMQEWATFANLQFIARTTQSNYVTIVDGGTSQEGGDSALGMVGGQQFIHIGGTSWNRGTICHELGHTLGLIHEHQRSDRDSFVTILTNNIITGLEANFVKLTNSRNKTAYDFLSIMHYSRNTFSTDPAHLDTIEPLPAYSQYLNLIGNSDPVLSALDRAGMALEYGVGPTLSAVVTHTHDSGAGSLRAAIYYALDHPGTTITFNIPTTDPGFSGCVFTINPTDRFPNLVNQMIIDGTTEPTNTNPNGPEIVLNGSLAAQPDVFANGLNITGSNCVVRGLVISRFNGSGLAIEGSNAVGNVVSGCYIGTDPTGTAALSNIVSGVLIGGGAHANTIGGTVTADCNVISGNANQGIIVTGTNTDANVVQGNYIGLMANGAAGLANALEGVVINGGAKSNLIGGCVGTACNVISGNNQGIHIADPGSNGNVVQGNCIGLSADGSMAIPNAFDGVTISGGAKSNLIGGATTNARNVISGNGARGVGVFDPGTDGNVLQANFIGTDPLGAAAFANVMDGIDISGGARSNLIGGTMVGSANVISGNGLYGITIGGAGTDGTIVRGNLIGLDASGSAALANGFAGVIVYGGARLTQLGGTIPGARNVISAHHSYNAIITDPGTQANVFQGNFVGLNAAGTAAVANTTFAGVAVFGGAQSNTVGGGVGARNVVSGNASYGVFISDTNTDANVVQGNTIGLDPTGTIAIGNGVSGVVIQNAARSNQVGGATLGASNLIASNGTYGVVVFDTGTTNNSIAGNSIFGNGSAGIALVGGNLSRPAPLLTSAVVGTNTVVNGMLTSSPNATFRIEFFANPTGLATAQGQTFLGAISATTGSGGTVTFSAGLSSTVPSGQRITATATDPAGNTSPFSSFVTVSTTDTDGDGLPDQWELAQFGTLAQSANGDPDGDGSTNMQEFRAGTNPKGSASALKVTFASQGGTDVIVGFPSVAGRIYRVEMKDSLIQTSWVPLADQLVGTGGTIQITDPGAATLCQRFYRVVVLP